MANQPYPPTPTPEEDQYSGMEVDTPSESESTARTALIPNEFFGGKPITPGTVCSVRIERALDGQVQVSYVEHGAESESDLGEEPEEEGDEEMSDYMNE